MKFNKKHLTLSLICVALLFSCWGYAQENDDEIEIVWIGHSCFEIGFHECRILIDPFSPESYDHVLPSTKYDIVFATHKAQDHYYFDGVEADVYLLARGDKSEFVSERRNEERNITGKTTKKTATSSFSFWTVASYHDDQHGAVNGVNGIICFDFNGIKVVHLGDLGHVLEDSQLKQIGRVDVLMIPVDGYFTIDMDTAKTIIRQLTPKIVFPMHYRTKGSKTTRSVYTEDVIFAGFENIKKMDQSHLVVDRRMLDQAQQVIILDYSKQKDFPCLKGPYLGQKPPGMTPEVFAPGILNTKERGAFCFVFSPDGNEFYFVYYERENENSGGMARMKRIDDAWSEPEMLPFNSSTFDNDMCLSADGKRLVFRSWRALPDGEKPKDHSYLWYVERIDGGWSRAKPLYCANSPVRTGYPSMAENGNLYFAHKRDEIFGIYRSKPIDGDYGIPELVFTAVDSIKTEGDLFIAPDESYMIISCWNHPDNIGSSQGDLYITFQRNDGTWTEERNMGELINTRYGENCPQVTPDGKYFFFNRYDPDNKEGNTYWVDANLIQTFKPEEIK